MSFEVRLDRATISAPGAELGALVYSPSSPRGPIVILAHGYTGSKETMDVPAGYLCSRGWRCVTFDFRGHKLGSSTGEMRHAADGVLDTRAAIAFARRRFGADEAALVGHSYGGSVALAAAAEDPAVVAVAVMGTGRSVASGFDTPAGDSLMALRGDYVRGAPAAVILAEAATLSEPKDTPNHVSCLFIAARGDIIVRPESVRELARLYKADADMVVVDGGHMDLPVRARGHTARWLEGLSVE